MDAPANDVPRPEKLYDAEAGYSRSSNRLSLNANAYFMYYTDQLVLTGAINDVGSAIMVNVPKSYRAGIELSAHALLAEMLKWEASVALSKNKINSFTEYIDDWDNGGQIAAVHSNTDLALSPAVVAGSQITWLAARGLDLGLISKYVGRQYIDNTQSSDRQLDAYLVNNLLVSYTFKSLSLKEIVISLMVNNLFNVKYESNAWVYRYSEGSTFQKLDGYFPQAGINMMIGVKIGF